MPSYQRPAGTLDTLPEDQPYWYHVQARARLIWLAYKSGPDQLRAAVAEGKAAGFAPQLAYGYLGSELRKLGNAREAVRHVLHRVLVPREQQHTRSLVVLSKDSRQPGQETRELAIFCRCHLLRDIDQLLETSYLVPDEADGGRINTHPTLFVINVFG